MTQGKDPTPLFEIIHKAPRGAPKAVRVPEWMRSAEEMERQVESAAPPARPTRPSLMDWWRRPLRFRLQLGVLCVCGVTVAAAIIVAFLVGRKFEERSLKETDLSWSAANQSLEPARQQTVNHGLIAPTVQRNLPVEGAPPGGKGAGGDASDPREPGLNYFRLVTLPLSAADEGGRAVAFLQGKGIDAVLLPDHNGRSVKLMALPGYTNPSSPEGKAFEERLKTLGRMWKSRERGSSDWSDLLAEKYKPGIN